MFMQRRRRFKFVCLGRRGCFELYQIIDNDGMTTRELTLGRQDPVLARPNHVQKDPDT